MKVLVSTLDQFQAWIARETVLSTQTVEIHSEDKAKAPKSFPCVVSYTLTRTVNLSAAPVNVLRYDFVYKEDFVETAESEEKRLEQFATQLLKDLGTVFDLNNAKERLTKMVMEATTNEQRAIWQKHLEYVVSLIKKN